MAYFVGQSLLATGPDQFLCELLNVIVSEIRNDVHDFKTQKGNIEQTLLDAIVNQEKDLVLNAKPEMVMVAETLTSSDSRAKGGYSITKIYRVGTNDSLIVNYQIGGFLKPSAFIPIGVISAAAKAFVPGDNQKIVGLKRKEIRCLAKSLNF